MLSISISRITLDFGGRLAAVTIAGATRPLLEAGGEECAGRGVERASRERGQSTGADQPLLLGKSHSGSPASGLFSQPSGEDGLRDALNVLQKPVSEVFPENRIFTHCKKCGAGIERFKGYKHYWVGDRGTYCRDCHLAMGLPLRDDDVADLRRRAVPG
jgi:hypothetical protein